MATRACTVTYAHTHTHTLSLSLSLSLSSVSLLASMYPPPGESRFNPLLRTLTRVRVLPLLEIVADPLSVRLNLSFIPPSLSLHLSLSLSLPLSLHLSLSLTPCGRTRCPRLSRVCVRRRSRSDLWHRRRRRQHSAATHWSLLLLSIPLHSQPPPPLRGRRAQVSLSERMSLALSSCRRRAASWTEKSSAHMTRPC
jgi:hypothetical protein